MAWQRRVRHKPTVYAVHWPEINVFKVGFSEYRRWRAFEARGANVLDLMMFDHFKEAFDFELACHLAMSEVCRSAFKSGQEAACYLGSRGGGYKECYRVPGDLMPNEILKFIDFRLAALAGPKHMPEHDAPEQSTDVTDVLTQNYSPSEHVLTLGNARGGDAKNG